MLKLTVKWTVKDCNANDVGSPEFDHYHDACDWIDTTIDRVYGELTDDDYDEQRGEYVIYDVTSDEDNQGN